MDDFQEGTPKAALIDSIVNDSFKANSTPNRSTAAPIGRPIRAGGRPKKNGAPNKATLALIQAEFEGSKSTPPPQPESTSASGGGDTSSAFSENESMKADDIPDAAMMEVLKFPFNVARARTGFDGYRLEDDKARELTPLLKAVIEIYLPNVPSKHMPAIILAGTLASVFYKQYCDHVQDEKKFKAAKPVDSTVAPTPAPAVYHPEVSS